MKIRNKSKYFLIAGTALLPFAMFADSNFGPTPEAAPRGSQIQTQLWVQVKDDTKQVHLISANNDPNIITKVYVLKNADPYELRPYFREAVKAKRIAEDYERQANGEIKSNVTKVECIKYNDGTGALIVSAEDYRFGKQANGMGFDDMVALLDQPKIKSTPGNAYYAYFPKYCDANWLYTLLRNVGLNHPDDPTELEGGRDKVGVDKNLNALLFNVPKYQVKTINEMIKQYDTPTTEVAVKYTIYEIDAENDGQIGVDFQAWKNGPGSDLFSLANRTGYQWDFANNIVNMADIGKQQVKYIKFNPKWNTKYLDFLVSKSKAHVITSGDMAIMNAQEGYVECKTSLANYQAGEKIPDINMFDYIKLTGQTVNPDGTLAAAGVDTQYMFSATDKQGNSISLNVAYFGNFMLSRSFDGYRYYYTAEIDTTTGSGTFFIGKGGQNIGHKVNCYNASLQLCTATTVGVDPTAANSVTSSYSWVPVTSWQTDQNFTMYKNRKTDTAINSYGFNMRIKPVVCEKATTLEVSLVNNNLIGFKSDGSPRISKSEMNTQVMVDNGGNKFVIGGLEKKAVVKSVNKLPWLGDIPLLGWILGSESETTKKSQLVCILECVPAAPNTPVPEKITAEMKEVNAKTVDAGDKNSYGFDQLLIDKDKKGFDPLP